MPEIPRRDYESGETVNTFEELAEAMKGQPKGFNLLINIWWGDQQSIWRRVEEATGLKITLLISGMSSYEGKPTCLIKLTVL